jgi:hypothetical protein
VGPERFSFERLEREYGTGDASCKAAFRWRGSTTAGYLQGEDQTYHTKERFEHLVSFFKTPGTGVGERLHLGVLRPAAVDTTPTLAEPPSL